MLIRLNLYFSNVITIFFALFSDDEKLCKDPPSHLKGSMFELENS